MAREYEVSQLIQLMQTVGDQSPLHATLVASVVDHMDVQNREQLIQQIEQASQPDPEAMKRAQEEHQMAMRAQGAQIGVYEATARESDARARKYLVEAELEPKKVQADVMDAVADVRDGVTTREFQQRLEIADRKLKERELNIKEKDIDIKREQATADREAQKALKAAMTSDE